MWVKAADTSNAKRQTGPASPAFVDFDQSGTAARMRPFRHHSAGKGEGP
jgi:hypothetical protein